MSEISASDIESISSAVTQSDRITDAGGADASVVANVESVKHPRFFFESKVITFRARLSVPHNESASIDENLKVEETLYRVHDYLFTANSEFWSRKLDKPCDGSTILELDVTKPDMDAFLAILYNRYRLVLTSLS